MINTIHMLGSVLFVVTVLIGTAIPVFGIKAVKMRIMSLVFRKQYYYPGDILRSHQGKSSITVVSASPTKYSYYYSSIWNNPKEATMYTKKLDMFQFSYYEITYKNMTTRVNTKFDRSLSNILS